MCKRLELIIFFGVLTTLCMSGALAQEVNVSKSEESIYNFDFDKSEGVEREEMQRRHLIMRKEQKRRIKKGYEKFKNLLPEEQERLKERWRRFKSLPKDQQETIKKRQVRFQKMSKDDRQKLKRRYHRWDDFSPEQRQRLKDRQKSFQDDNFEQGKSRDEQFHQRKLNKLKRKSDHGRDKSKWREKKQ